MANKQDTCSSITAPVSPSLDGMITALRVEITILEAKPIVARQHIAALHAALAQLKASRWRPIVDAPNIYGSGADIQLTDGRRQWVGCLVRDCEGRRCWKTDGDQFVSPTHFHLLLPVPPAAATKGDMSAS